MIVNDNLKPSNLRNVAPRISVQPVHCSPQLPLPDHTKIPTERVVDMAENSMSTPPRLSLLFALFIAFYGIIATSMAVAAEIGKAQKYTYLSDFENLYQCHYPKNYGTVFAFTSAFVSLIGLSITTFYVGWIINREQSRYVPSRYDFLMYTTASLAWLTFGASFTLLVYGGVNNGLTSSTSRYSLSELRCPLSPTGIFASAGVFSVFSLIFAESYYLLALQVKSEEWKIPPAARSGRNPLEVGGPLSTVIEEDV